MNVQPSHRRHNLSVPLLQGLRELAQHAVVTPATRRVERGATNRQGRRVTLARMFRPTPHPPTEPPAAAIYRLRQRHGLSYRDLARRIETRGRGVLDHGQIHRIEHGGGYTSASLALIADAFGVPIAALFADDTLAPLWALPEPERARALAKVTDYCADLGAAYSVRRNT